MAFYQGSRLLEPIAEWGGIQLDQVNFMVGELMALALAFAYRLYLHPSDVGKNVRHAVAAGAGFTLGFFCFGMGFFHMILQAAVCYILMLIAPSSTMHILVFVSAMLYLSFMHIYRMSYDYGGYVLDVTGPMMLSTQRLTCLAFNLHDGINRKADSLTADQKQHAINKVPNPLVFAGYMFNFFGLLAGPMSFYHDYIQFVEGKNYVGQSAKRITGSDGSVIRERTLSEVIHRADEPDPKWTVLKKFIFSMFALYVAFAMAPKFPVEQNYSPDFIASHYLPYRIIVMILTIAVARGKYYFAWKFGEAVNNAAGLGFSGYSEDGEAEWDLVTNVHVRKLELATSLKVLLDNWNVQTALWLRRICYDRAPKAWRTSMVFTLSAMWHGFYPGYYFCFIGALPFTMTARMVRRTIRPWWQTSREKIFVYDVITWFFSQYCSSYLILAFATLEFWPVIYFYTYSMYWHLHIAVIIAYVYLTMTKPKSSSSRSTTCEAQQETIKTNINPAEPDQIPAQPNTVYPNLPQEEIKKEL